MRCAAMRGAFHRFVCTTLSECIVAFVLINQKSVYKTINCEWGACHMELLCSRTQHNLMHALYALCTLCASCTHMCMWCGRGIQKSNALLSEQIAVGRANCDATHCAHIIHIRRQFNFIIWFVCTGKHMNPLIMAIQSENETEGEATKERKWRR